MLEFIIATALFVSAVFAYFGIVKMLFGSTEEDEMSERDTNDVYDAADGNELLAAKVRCLELAIKNGCGMIRTTDAIVKEAKQFWDFLTLEESDDE